MARHLFGGVADYVISVGTANAATLQPGATVTCWSAAVGGTQYTDLTATDGVTPIANGELTTDSSGAVPEFMGPDGVTALYLDANGGSGPRRRTLATDVGQTLDTTSLEVSSYVMADASQSGATYANLPKGHLTRSNNAGVVVGSSFAGGEDDGTGTDTTGRLALYSYQRADVGGFGENIRRFLMRHNAKSMDAWYLPRASGLMGPGFDANGDPQSNADWVPVAWTGAHWKANDGLSIHGHWSVEVPDSTGAVQTRLEVPFTDQEAADASKTLGVNVTNIRTNLADLTVRANLGTYGTGVLRIGGGNTVNKDLLLSNSADRASSGERWKIRANNVTESGLNAGTDFQILRHNDSGVLLGTAMRIERKTGQVAFGGDTSTGGSVRTNWSASGVHGFYAVPATSPGTAAAFGALMTATTDRAVDVRVTGDTNARLVVGADGKVEMGDGVVRDTNLYRDAANSLKTDDSLAVALTFKHQGSQLGFYGAAPATKPVVTGSRGGNAALASLISALATLGLVTDNTTP